MLSIPKEVVFYLFRVKNGTCLLIISSLLGWRLVKIWNKFILLKKTNQLFSFYGGYLLNNFLGIYKLFLQFLVLKGMGYKFSIIGSHLILRIGQTHRLVYAVQKNIKIVYLNKQFLTLKSNSLILLKKMVYFLLKFGRKTVYKKKGIFLKGSLVNIKVSSKKSKF